MRKTIKEVQEEFKKLIIENPTLPIRFFVGEDAWSGEWAYNEAVIMSVSIQETTLHGDEYIELEDFEDALSDELVDEYEDDEHLEEAVKDIINNTKFEKAICVRINN